MPRREPSDYKLGQVRHQIRRTTRSARACHPPMVCPLARISLRFFRIRRKTTEKYAPLASILRRARVIGDMPVSVDEISLALQGNLCKPPAFSSHTKSLEAAMGRGLLLWIIGIPLPIILLIWLFGGLS